MLGFSTDEPGTDCGVRVPPAGEYGLGVDGSAIPPSTDALFEDEPPGVDEPNGVDPIIDPSGNMGWGWEGMLMAVEVFALEKKLGVMAGACCVLVREDDPNSPARSSTAFPFPPPPMLLDSSSKSIKLVGAAPPEAVPGSGGGAE